MDEGVIRNCSVERVVGGWVGGVVHEDEGFERRYWWG